MIEIIRLINNITIDYANGTEIVAKKDQIGIIDQEYSPSEIDIDVGDKRIRVSSEDIKKINPYSLQPILEQPDRVGLWFVKTGKFHPWMIIRIQKFINKQMDLFIWQAYLNIQDYNRRSLSLKPKYWRTTEKFHEWILWKE